MLVSLLEPKEERILCPNTFERSLIPMLESQLTQTVQMISPVHHILMSHKVGEHEIPEYQRETSSQHDAGFSNIFLSKTDFISTTQPCFAVPVIPHEYYMECEDYEKARLKFSYWDSKIDAAAIWCANLQTRMLLYAVRGLYRVNPDTEFFISKIHSMFSVIESKLTIASNILSHGSLENDFRTMGLDFFDGITPFYGHIGNVWNSAIRLTNLIEPNKIIVFGENHAVGCIPFRNAKVSIVLRNGKKHLKISFPFGMTIINPQYVVTMEIPNGSVS